MERFGPTRRGGPIFRWLGEPLAIDLANTVMVVRESEAVDLIDDPEDLHRWLTAERERLGDCGLAVAHQHEVLALRDAVRSLLTSSIQGATPSVQALEMLNTCSAAAPIAPQLITANDRRLRVVERAGDSDPVAELLGRLARSAIALLAGPAHEQPKMCTAPSCGMFFLGPRRWCCAACGNRARAARHYERTRAQRDETTAPR